MIKSRKLSPKFKFVGIPSSCPSLSIFIDAVKKNTMKLPYVGGDLWV
jgi:hypothetical protein